MKILIVGASGLVGGNIYSYFIKNTNWDVVGTYNNYQIEPFIKMDASDIKSWNDFINSTKWDVIIHTGALTHVDKCEQEPQLSEYLTVLSAQNLIFLAKIHQAKFVYISTDYVFDGQNGPYNETDKTAPLCVYGHHKLQAEKHISNELENYLILRITNVYGDEVRGKNFLSRIIAQIKKNENLEILAPSDQYSTPVNALDVAKVLYLLLKDKKTGLYNIASTDILSRVQFLYRVNLYFDQKLKIKPIKTKDFNQPANRPLKGGLLAGKFLNEYPNFIFSNIDDYLKIIYDHF